MDIIIRRPVSTGSFVDMVLPVTASLTEQRRWLLASLTAAVRLRGTSLYSDGDSLVYVDGEKKCIVGRDSHIEAIVDELIPEEGSPDEAYGDGQ